MNRGLGLCVVFLVLLGCQTTQPAAVREAGYRISLLKRSGVE